MTQKTLENKTMQNQVQKEAPRRELNPDVNIYTGNDSYVLEFALPGADEKSIDVSVEKNILTVKAKAGHRPAEGYQLYYSESAQGDYKRSFRLDEQIAVDEVAASYKNGMLTLVMPLKAPVSRKIEITSK